MNTDIAVWAVLTGVLVFSFSMFWATRKFVYFAIAVAAVSSMITLIVFEAF